MSTRTWRSRGFDLVPREPEPVDAPPVATPGPPAAHQYATKEEIGQIAYNWREYAKYERRAAVVRLLTRLEQFPGDTWVDRWLAFESHLPSPHGWEQSIRPGANESQRSHLSRAATYLVTFDVLRPSYQWLGARTMMFGQIAELRDPEDSQILYAKLEEYGFRRRYAQIGLRLAGKVQCHTGKPLREIAAQDLIDLRDTDADQVWRQGGSMLWRALHELGWIEHESATFPSIRRRQGQLSVEQMVDSYLPECAQRDVLVEYIKQRGAALDYSSKIGLARFLAKLYWRDVLDHHPELAEQPTFALTRAQADAWKERLRWKEDGTPRRGRHSVLFSVRGFHLDIAQWALQDSYWAPWVCPTPVSSRDMKGYNKERRRSIAEQHERTRQLAPQLPRLVAQAESDRKAAAEALADATTRGAGQQIAYEGELWTIVQREPVSPIRLRRNDTDGRQVELNLTQRELDAFWTWAIIETLRHTGVRHEELLELTHLAIQPYTVPSTGETIPLLHIAPSKTDTERLLVASPELMHVLAQIVARLRTGSQAVPLTQRWDYYDRQVSPLLPHLFAAQRNHRLEVISPNTVAKLVNNLAAKLTDERTGKPLKFTPQDMRRIFATDALASGLPPHIVQVLMGHKSLATTQVYAAIYPKDVIRHHRTFITQRRQSRPTEEYREPTAAEWAEFERHFVTRKVSLGNCGRAFGTSCQHEHACVRCSLLRPDPAQLDRLVDIISNLKERITEARQQGWLGEVEGLQVSLTGAEQKLLQMQRQSSSDDATVLLGLPRRIR